MVRVLRSVVTQFVFAKAQVEKTDDQISVMVRVLLPEHLMATRTQPRSDPGRLGDQARLRRDLREAPWPPAA